MTIERIAVLRSIAGRVLTLTPESRAAALKPGDVLKLSWSRSVLLPDMPLRPGQLVVQDIDQKTYAVTVDTPIMAAIPAALSCACECPDTVYRVETGPTRDIARCPVHGIAGFCNELAWTADGVLPDEYPTREALAADLREQRGLDISEVEVSIAKCGWTPPLLDCTLEQAVKLRTRPA